MKITVITACFNSAATIGDCVDSIQAQNYPDIEHLVIDGASTDTTVSVVESHSNGKSRILSEPDDGIYDALNKGIAKARGEVIGFLHADDMLEHESVLADVAKILADPAVDACYSDLYYVKSDDPDTVTRNWRSSAFQKGMFLRGWMPPHPTFYCRKPVYEELGNFNTKLQIGADWDLLVRFMEQGGIRTVYHPDVWVRMRQGGTSNRSIKNVAKNNWETWKQCRDYFGLIPSLQFPPRKWMHRLKQFNTSSP